MDVSLSELRTRLKEVMEEVKKGHNVMLTERGKPVAMIEPMYAPDPMRRVNNIFLKTEQFKQATGKTDLGRAQAAQRARDDILRGVNKKKP